MPVSFRLIRELIDFLTELDKNEYRDVRWVVEEVLSIVNALDLLSIHEDLSFRQRKAISRRVRAADEEEHRLFVGLTEIDRAVAIVEAVSARIEANDLSAVESLFAGQALALDAMFNHLAKEFPYEDIRLALRAQSQCRHTFKTLLALKTPRAEKISPKRTIEPAESPR